MRDKKREYLQEETEAWVFDIIYRASEILGPLLPGCSLRYYVLPPDSFPKERIFLCFRTEGPVLPFLDMTPLKYFNGIQSWICYKPMFLDSGLWDCFPGQRLPWDWEIKDGPEAVAKRLRQALSTFDFGEIDRIAAVENLMEDPPLYPDQARYFKRATCAIYLQKYQKAAELLEKYLSIFKNIDRSQYITIRQAENYLDKLRRNPEVIRAGMPAVISRNWSLLRPMSSNGISAHSVD
jgi:hypothetical protein